MGTPLEPARPALRPLPPGSGPDRWLAALDRVSRAQGRPFDMIAGACAGIVCLHSGRVNDGLGRWSIAAACPLAEIRGSVRLPTLRTWHHGRWTPHRTFKDPFEAVQTLLAPGARINTSMLRHLPFRGGAMGLFGYGCRAAVEAFEPDAPRWGEADVWWGLYDTFVAFDGVERTGQVISWGLPAWDAPPDPSLANARADALLGALEKVGPRSPGAWQGVDFKPEMPKARYMDAMASILGAIGEGRCYQACMTHPLKADRRPEVTARAIFERLQTHAPAPFSALIAPGGPLALAGASPERFMSVKEGRVRVRPMKGTRPRGATPEEDALMKKALIGSEKDRAENIMIVDLMRNDLGRVCQMGSVEVPALFTIETYASVHQMTSTVEGQLCPDVPVTEVIRACFAPGSMTGAPKVAATGLLDALEIGPRGWYSGVLGHLGWEGNADLSVVIRSALVSDDQVVWHVGGGIVADSTPEGEWRESLDKGPTALQRDEE